MIIEKSQMQMSTLKLHSGGKKEYLKQLEKQYKNKLNAIKGNKKLSDGEIKKGIEKIKLEYQRLKTETDFSVF